MSPHDNFIDGRRPREPDDRDWKVSEILSGEHRDRVSGTDLDKALAALIKSGWVSKAEKDWAKLVTAAIKELQPPAPAPIPDPTPTPTPVPVPVPVPTPDPTAAVRWETSQILDQGNTPHCVGFTGADFLGSAPVTQAVTTQLGHDLYYECKVIDGEAGKENGSDMRSIGKVLKNRGRIAGYAFASTVAEVKAWVRTQGTVMLGTNWYDGMFYPDSKGVIKIGGAVVGGHAWSIVGHDGTTGLYTAMNHWGTGYGDKGFFYFGDDVLARLLSEQGDAIVALELPLS